MDTIKPRPASPEQSGQPIAPPAAPPPPRRAHQITRVLEDAGAGDANQGSRILVFGGQREPLRVSAQWVSENLPAVGGYYIEEGGHARYSAK